MRGRVRCCWDLRDCRIKNSFRRCRRPAALFKTRFSSPLFGATLSLLISAFLHYGQSTRFWFLLSASVIYLIGTFGATGFGNVPLNNTLDRFDLESASLEEITRQRANFERRWKLPKTLFYSTSRLTWVSE